jgi:glycosyltransferase involved in cell wall biosynthesis
LIRLLLVLPQLPQDRSTGAPRSVTGISEWLAAGGFDVRAVATTAVEQAGRLTARDQFAALGIRPEVVPGRVRPELRYSHRGIHYRLLDTGGRDVVSWERALGRQFDLLFDGELEDFQPDIVFTYGGSAADERRHERARRSGAKLVFGLRNLNYLNAGRAFFRRFDAIITPGEYMRRRYREEAGVECAAFPPPCRIEDIVAGDREPAFLTMINPTPRKGLMFFARLAEELSVRRPDIPILVVESVGAAGHLLGAAEAGGFDLRRHENIMVSPPVPKPSDIYGPTRVLLAPSVEEPFGRVACEALLNGIPPLVSDRGGLPEAVNGAGFVLPLPPGYTIAAKRPLEPAAVRPWIEVVERLYDDEPFYQEQCARAREASKVYLPENLAPKYVRFFQDLVTGSTGGVEDGRGS